MTSTATATFSPRPTVSENYHEITKLLLQRLSEQLDKPVSDIDQHEDFVALGLNSLEGVNLASELEWRLGCQLPQTIFWDYSNVSDLAKYLADLVTPDEQSPQVNPHRPEQVDHMSEAELDRLIASMSDNTPEVDSR